MSEWSTQQVTGLWRDRTRERAPAPRSTHGSQTQHVFLLQLENWLGNSNADIRQSPMHARCFESRCNIIEDYQCPDVALSILDDIHRQCIAIFQKAHGFRLNTLIALMAWAACPCQDLASHVHCIWTKHMSHADKNTNRLQFCFSVPVSSAHSTLRWLMVMGWVDT